MIPVTYPSSVSTSKESQMVVFALSSVAGLQRWTDYIPVKFQATGTANSFNTGGYLACDFLPSSSGKQSWIDYIPVFVDVNATDAWQVSATGFIPFNTLAGGGLGSSLDFNFVATGTLDPSITFTRASTGTFFNSAGVLTSANSNIPRFDYNPSTLAAQGLLIEEQRTNSIRNNTMQGAVVGTPGTLPTNWLAPTPSNGLNRQIVGTGTENGINYVDVRYSGTTSAASLTAIYWESATQVAAASGQTWTNSVYVALVGGSTANTTGVVVGIDENNGAGGFLTGSSTTFVPSAGALTGKRVSHTKTLTNASTAFVWPYVFFSYGNGAAIDITLRIGLPQLEQGAFATSVIPTTTTALTRSADVASVNTLSPWFNASASTLYAEWTNIAAAMAPAFQTVVVIDDASLNNIYRIFQVQAANAKASQNMISGGASAGRIDAGGAYSNATVKAAAAFATLDRAIAVNGQSAVTSTTGALPVSVTQMSLGNTSSTTTNFLNGYLRRITYYPRRLSNAELVSITT